MSNYPNLDEINSYNKYPNQNTEHLDHNSENLSQVNFIFIIEFSY